MNAGTTFSIEVEARKRLGIKKRAGLYEFGKKHPDKLISCFAKIRREMLLPKFKLA